MCGGLPHDGPFGRQELAMNHPDHHRGAKLEPGLETEYRAYLQQKVDAARLSVKKGRGRPNAEVAQEFALRHRRRD